MYLLFVFSSLIEWTELPFIWIHSMCCSYSCSSFKIRVARNFTFFWRVCIRNMLFCSLLCFLLWSDYIILNIYWFVSFVYQREAEFYEPSSLHGSNCCCFPSPCHTNDGRKCGWHYIGSCQRWREDHLVSAI